MISRSFLHTHSTKFTQPALLCPLFYTDGAGATCTGPGRGFSSARGACLSLACRKTCFQSSPRSMMLWAEYSSTAPVKSPAAWAAASVAHTPALSFIVVAISCLPFSMLIVRRMRRPTPCMHGGYFFVFAQILIVTCRLPYYGHYFAKSEKNAPADDDD